MLFNWLSCSYDINTTADFNVDLERGALNGIFIR